MQVDINAHEIIFVLYFYYFLAQQEAQRAQFAVEKAKQERQQKIVQAEGEAQAATLISFDPLLVKTLEENKSVNESVYQSVNH